MLAKKLTLIRHTGEPDAMKTTKQVPSGYYGEHVDSFDGAQINLEFSGIPDDVNGHGSGRVGDDKGGQILTIP